MARDLIGQAVPPDSSAPPWPEGWRKRWDPFAPVDYDPAPAPPSINPFPQFTDTPTAVTGEGLPEHSVQVEVDGLLSKLLPVGLDGGWSWTPLRPTFDDTYCLRARQRGRITEWSEWTDVVCVTLGPMLGQSLGMDGRGTRFGSTMGWATRGVVAVRANERWIYGTLRRAVGD